jgi:hypothetical protein
MGKIRLSIGLRKQCLACQRSLIADALIVHGNRVEHIVGGRTPGMFLCCIELRNAIILCKNPSTCFLSPGIFLARSRS